MKHSQKRMRFTCGKHDRQKKKLKHKFEVGDLAGTAQLMKNVSKVDTTSSSFNICGKTKKFQCTIPSYHIKSTPENYYET